MLPFKTTTSLLGRSYKNYFIKLVTVFYTIFYNVLN